MLRKLAPVELAELERKSLSQLILDRRDEIESRWLEKVTADVTASGLDLSELHTWIDDYVTRLAHSIASGGPSEQSGTATWIQVASEHAITRVRSGFDVGQLVHEFIVLRRVLAEVIRSAEPTVKLRETDTLSELIEAAMAASVKSYVESRDYAMRKVEAEHVGFLTHELRNPLGTAILAATQLRQRVALSPELVRLLDLLDRSHGRLKTLIDDVLAAERHEAGMVEPQKVDTHIGQLLKEALVSAREAAMAKGLDFLVSSDRDMKVKLDRELTTSALQNLAENAVKFTDHGRVEVTVEDGPLHVVVHVRDTCGGIPDDDIARIFEPFRRGHHGKSGTGLGLAIARRAIEAQGGTMSAESKPNHGCHFWFTLPREPNDSG